MTFRRGFKSYAIRVAADFRREMQLSPLQRFDPFVGAQNLGIPVFRFSELLSPGSREFRDLVRPDGPVSAFTIFTTEYRRAFCYNDTRASTRVVSDLSHELAHTLLFHPAHAAMDLSCVGLSPEVESEAAHLSGVLLVSDEAALNIVESGMDLNAASSVYGVSLKMMQYRINASGAYTRVSRRRSYRTGTS